ncbi:ammonium transporter Rh type A-like [Protopterus annectens]|uniref:ammonium transporter Rh type A-like n=1 Tax=Protopterus annectens TaxID=7888 RepID=UPI001CFB6860|nr:ammonium transporter Rh type A-like [Protopterus annectens]
MAPRYAPRIRVRIVALLLFLETLIICLFAVFGSYGESRDDILKKKINTYPEFQDVHVILFLGFGFTVAFLRQYGFSSMGFCFLIAAFGVQWSLLMDGFLLHLNGLRFPIDLQSLVMANLSAVSALISMGAVLGKVNPVQLILMTLLEVTAFSANRWALWKLLEIKPVHSTMYVHMFGAYFGVMVSWCLYNAGLKYFQEKEESKWRSGLLSMFGTLFLWMFWPSFNAILIQDHEDKQIAMENTYCALAVSTVVAFAFSVLCNKNGKLEMVYIRNATLAGGIALSSSADLINVPWIAMTVGFLAALIATFGYRSVKPFLQSMLQIHDTCGVLCLFGLPGLIGAFTRITLITMDNLTQLHTLSESIIREFASLCMTVATSLIAGLLTGFILKCRVWKAPQLWKYFDDQAYWEFPHLIYKL